MALDPRVVANHQATGVRTFISPNAVYFTTTLVVSATLMIPHLSVLVSGGLLSLGALGTLGYLAYTKVHHQWRDNKLSVFDWAWFVGLPIAAYVLLLLSGVGFILRVALAGYAIGAALILLLVI